MSVNPAPKQGDMYWVEENSHRYVIITPKAINVLGISMAVPVAATGSSFKSLGLVVPIVSSHTSGVAVCNQIRSFDIGARVELGQAGYVETLEPKVTAEIVNRVLSVIEPATV